MGKMATVSTIVLVQCISDFEDSLLALFRGDHSKAALLIQYDFIGVGVVHILCRAPIATVGLWLSELISKQFVDRAG